jgi:phytoene/squalene synthetase
MGFKLAQATPNKPPLKDRIAEIDAYIDELVEKDAGCGIPRPVLRNMLTGRAGDCQRRQYLIQTRELT